MLHRLYRQLACLILIAFCSASWANGQFKITHIQIQGLEHIQKPTVMHYIPAKVGQPYTAKLGDEIVTKLYKTGFFSNIQLAHQGGQLIVKVTELPTIGYIHFNGNSVVSDDQLEKIQQQTGLEQGQLFNKAALKEVSEGLKQQYIYQGYYGATVKPKITPLAHNMVGIDVNVVQGGIARVQRIQILGNKVFAEHYLLNQIQLTTPNLFSFLTDSDHYSKAKLEQDLNSLQDFYFNHGYLKYQLISKQVVLTPDHRNVYITLRISEGAQYQVNDVQLPTDLAKPLREHIAKMVQPMIHEPFSRQKIVTMNQKIAEYLGKYGYAFPDVNVNPKLNDIKHTVVLQYQIHPHHRYYVRHINFKGNHRTRSMILRYNMRQMEGELYSSTAIKESKRRLANLPYIRNVQMQPEPVKGKPDELDLDYHVDDVSAGRASFNVGYSDLMGFLYGVSASQGNFLGTGRYLGLSLQRSAYQDNYSLSYNNPFYTIYGLSRGFNLSYSKITPGKVNLSNYTQDNLNVGVNFSMPISEYNSLNFGLSYDYNYIRPDENETPQSIQDYIKKHGNTFNEADLSLGWSNSNLDQYLFPTSGLTQNLNLDFYAPLDSKSLTYYKVSYSAGAFFPLTKSHSFVLNFHTNLGYGGGLFGTKGLPFFSNFYAGGIGTVPGFEGNSLGPQAMSPEKAKGDALGGNVLLVGGADFIFPNPIGDSVRTALTFNAGNIYQDKVKLNNLRYSVGLMLIWRSPLGPLDFSLAKALNSKPGDKLSVFQFTMGASFS